jgi:hypothetical protein
MCVAKCLILLPYLKTFHFACFAKIRDAKLTKQFAKQLQVCMCCVSRNINPRFHRKPLFGSENSTAGSLFSYSSVFRCFAKFFVKRFAKFFVKHFARSFTKRMRNKRKVYRISRSFRLFCCTSPFRQKP